MSDSNPISHTVSTQAERWLPVVGYEGWYEVSSWGRVRRIAKKRGRLFDEYCLLTPFRSIYGYMRVNLWSNGNRTVSTVHRLVLEAFVGPRPNKYEIDHINNDKEDNRLCNLEYVTKSENMLRAYATGAMCKKRGRQ